MRTQRRLIVTLAIIAFASTGLTRAAGARDSVLLMSGPSMTPCAPDPNVMFTSPSTPSPQPAVVGTGAPADPCAVQDDLGHPGKSHCITTTNSSDVSATFTVTFQLPPLYGNAALSLFVKADDWAQVALNGHPIGFACHSPPVTLGDSNPIHFAAGTNTLTFLVANNPGCSPSSTPRSGPDDAMNLQFEGTVTYDPPPSGGGINLGWDDCGGLPASLNQAFACDTNVGTHTLIGSFLAPSCVTGMTANEVVIDLETTGLNLPPWWGMRTGGCRAGALSLNLDFTAGPFTCYDYWQGAAIGGISEDAPVGNRARIKSVMALPSGDPHIQPVQQGTEVYSFKVRISNSKTTGLGACAGCGNGVCLVLQSLKINQVASNPCGGKFIGSPATRAYVTWQGGIGADCYAATPAKNVTWGQIKARYR